MVLFIEKRIFRFLLSAFECFQYKPGQMFRYTLYRMSLIALLLFALKTLKESSYYEINSFQ